VKLLEVQPEIAAGAPPAPNGETPQDQPAAATRACTSCGAAMEPGQDWCLACGTAAGPLGERPGWRSAMTVLGLTLLLVAGAVAASFAALSDDRPATAPAGTTGQVAQVPPPAVTTAPPAATTTTPTTGETTGKALPKVDAPSSGRPSTPSSSASPKPVTPAPSATPRSVTPTAPPSTGSGSSGSGSSGSGSTGSPGTTTDATPAPAPEAIALADGAASVYDPYGRATATGAPGRALDGDGGTSWYVDPPPGAQQVGVGYALNLGGQRGVRVVEITTPTPGFRVEVYASDEATAPPNILDTRWAHITDKSDVGTNQDGGATRIVLGAGTSKYQTLLLWITKPPSDGTRVRISELKVLG
jgi:hypothetical protein